MLFSQQAVDTTKNLPIIQPIVASQVIALDLASALTLAKNDNPILKVAKAKVKERHGLIVSARADALPQFGVSGNATRRSDLPDLKVHNHLGVKVTVSQPLFHWGTISSSVKAACSGEQEAKFHYDVVELDVLHGVAISYASALIAKAELEVIQTKLKTAEQFLATIKAKLETQTATTLDLLRAESDYLMAAQDKLQIETRYKNALVSLNNKLAISQDITLKLSDLGTPNIDFSLGSIERSEIAQYKQQENMYRINEKIIKSSLRPSFDFKASYGYDEKLKSEGNASFFKKSHNVWQAGIVVNFTIFDGLRTQGKLAENRAKIEQVVQMRKDKEHAISLEQSKAERELNEAIVMNKTANKAYDASLEELQTSRDFFEQGLITSLELLQAEHKERQQENKRRCTELNIWIAWFNYRRSYNLSPI